jgi:hypothetical protein
MRHLLGLNQFDVDELNTFELGDCSKDGTSEEWLYLNNRFLESFETM